MYLLLWAACVAAAPTPGPLAIAVDGIPHVVQRPDFCGEACLAMAMAGRGLPVDQDVVFALTGLDPAEGRGAWTKELVRAAVALGFEPGTVWFDAPDAAARQAAFDAMVDDLRAGNPSVVCMRFDGAPGAPEHFRLVTGYDARTDEVRYHDPARTRGADVRMSRARFLRLWPLDGKRGPMVIRLRLAGSPRLPEGVSPLPAALAQAVIAARARIGEEPGFTLRVQPPWVVVGDAEPAVVEFRARETVAWTTAQLRKHFFARDPQDVWTIWLFRDDASYVSHAASFFGDVPSTPYGYASTEHWALIMNIGTGGGTLVHEMVHPFIAANLPECPPWINEGLASLYEHVGEENGHIWGYPNWRLAGLQQAIRDGDLPSVRWLTDADAATFYGEGGGVHYAMARYLMQYLQDTGRLDGFIAAYTARREADPTGYHTLIDVLGAEDVGAFAASWKRWVMDLRRGG